MKVKAEELTGTAIRQLVVVESSQADVHIGQVVGHLCPECKQADETLDQIWHRDECSHAGEHGRQHYDELTPTVEERPTPEFNPNHEITIVHARTDRGIEIHDNEPIAFRCSCGNLDEDLFEVIHDDACPLSSCSEQARG
jgi:Zn ribbon nucleic-acid-binding protein